MWPFVTTLSIAEVLALFNYLLTLSFSVYSSMPLSTPQQLQRLVPTTCNITSLFRSHHRLATRLHTQIHHRTATIHQDRYSASTYALYRTLFLFILVHPTHSVHRIRPITMRSLQLFLGRLTYMPFPPYLIDASRLRLIVNFDNQSLYAEFIRNWTSATHPAPGILLNLLFLFIIQFTKTYKLTNKLYCGVVTSMYSP
jgi:hypothetical protein